MLTRWFVWTLLMARSKAKLKSNGHKAFLSLRVCIDWHSPFRTTIQPIVNYCWHSADRMLAEGRQIRLHQLTFWHRYFYVLNKLIILVLSGTECSNAGFTTAHHQCLLWSKIVGPNFKRFLDSFKYYLSLISISGKRFFSLEFQTNIFLR